MGSNSIQLHLKIIRMNEINKRVSTGREERRWKGKRGGERRGEEGSEACLNHWKVKRLGRREKLSK